MLLIGSAQGLPSRSPARANTGFFPCLAQGQIISGNRGAAPVITICPDVIKMIYMFTADQGVSTGAPLDPDLFLFIRHMLSLPATISSPGGQQPVSNRTL